MNDLTQIPDSGTEFQFSDSVVQDMIRQRQLYQNTQVAQGMEGDADTAAHAVRLESATGLPATVITPNYDQFVDQQKKLAAQEIVNGNTDLQSYIMSHPLATTVSNDDWATLDKFTRESSSSWLKGLADVTNPTPKVVSDFVDSVLQGGVQGAAQGLATGAPMDEATQKFVDPDQQGRLRAAVNKSLYDSVDVVTRMGNALMGGISGAVGGGGEALGLSKVEQEALLNNQMAESGMHMHAPEAEAPKPQTAMDVARPYLTAGEEPPAGLHPEIDAHKAALNAEFLAKLEEDLSNAVASTTRERAPELFAKLTERMYGESTISLHADAAVGLYGDKLPAADDKLLGWVPDIDTQLAAARDIGSDVQIPLKHWMAQVDPDVAKAVRDDIRVWPGGVTANEAKELVAPEPDAEAKYEAEHGAWADNRRSLTENSPEYQQARENVNQILDAKLAAERAVGDYASDARLAEREYKDDPEFLVLKAKASGMLQQYQDAVIAQRDLGYKLQEAAGPRPERPPTPKQIIDEALPSVRAGAGLEPKLSIGDRKLSLDLHGKLTPDMSDSGVESHYYNINDENGKRVGKMSVTPGPDKKTLYMDYIGGKAGLWANSFGPALVRDLKAQLKGLYPDYEYLTGHRVTGARVGLAAAGEETPMPLPRVRLSADGADLSEHQKTLDILQNGWERSSEGSSLLVDRQGPEAYTREQMALGQATADEITKLTGGKAIPQGVAGIAKEGSSQTVRGAYAPQYDSAPKIFYDLLGPDPKGIGRHESIHMLRDYGMFKPEEWSALEQAAHTEGWLDRYGIHERYPHLDDASKTEEAIAEGFREWAAQAEDVRPKTGVGALFQKIWDFLDRIRQGMGKYLGREPTWDEVFQRTASGEVGQRTPGVPRQEGQFRFSQDNGQIKPHLIGTQMPHMTPGNIDYDITRQRSQSYNGAVAHQTIMKNIDKLTDVRDYDGWRQGPHENPAGNVAEASLGGKTTMLVMKDGRRAMYQDGQRIAWDPNPMLEPKLSVEDERKANIEGMTNLQAASIGMDAQSFRRIQDAIRKQGEEDLRRETARAEKEETKRQTREWKANRSEMAKEVAPEIRQRPDVAADLFVGSGELYGQKLKQRIPLAEDRLTPEQKAALPDHYYAKSGVDPDHVAGLFGLQSGDELVASLARTEALKNVGGKRMRTEDFIRKIISDETDRRMEMRYGDLQANILDAAKDSALSKSSLNVMHEELMAVAQKARVTVFDRATIDKAAQGLINEFPLGKINSFRVMQEMGRHARNAEKAIAKGDWAEAAVHMQKQTVAAHVAAEAKRLEGEIAKFDKVAKRWAKRDQPSVPVEFGNWVHDILQRIGKPVRMTPEDLQRQIRGESATAQTFEEFVREQSEMGSAIDAWEGLLDPKWNKPYKTLTAEEFRGVRDTVQTLIETGRLTKKIVAQGAEFDRDEVIGQLIDKVRELPFKSVDAQGKESIVTRMPKGYLTRALQAETIFGRWDGFDPWGVWTQKVFRDLKDADNQADAWRKEYSKRLSALEDGVDLNKAITNKVFKAPVQYGGGFVSMNRGSLRAVMLNLGSESNIAKLTKGWQVDEKAVRAFVDAHATAEDWKFVQGVWDIFGELKEKSDTMYRSMGRMASKTIEAQPVETPHGTFRGGYYPVMFHEVYAKVPKVESASGLLDPSYESLTPNAGYTVARKNFFQPLTMGLDRLPGRLNQIIHDTAMRPSVENFGKVMYDGRVKAAIQTHAGIEVYDNMVNYIKGVANKANTGVQLWKDGAAVSSFMRQNIMAGLVGFNPGTILKHGFTAAGLSMKEVGLPRFFNAVRSLHSVDKATGESNYQFAMQHSLELQRRDRNFDESLHGAVGNLSPVQDTRLAGKNLGPVVEKFLDYRQRLIEMSGKPLAFSDKLSSVPTWLAAYDKHIEEGMTHGDAVFAADRAVRRAHGSTSITSRPTLMNELNPWLTTFYNFFNDVFNRQTETLWRAGEAMDLAKKGQWDKARGVAGTVAAGVFAYSIWPALVENWVTPQENDPKDGWAKRAAKGMAFTEGATLPVVRDFTSMLLEGKNPDVGLFSTAYEHGTDLIRDLEKKQPLAPAHTQGLIRASSELLALFTGAPEQFGKLASGGYGLAAGTEHPRGPWAWGVLGRYGTLKGHSQTAGQYLAGQYERRR